MDGQGSMIHGVTSPTTSARPGTANSTKRKRSGLDFESSPGTGGEADDDGLERHTPRQPGVKRACNECRQQKLKCDVQQDPFHACSRCTRLKLTCKIDHHFKRVGKRSKHAEMERTIETYKAELQRAQSQGYVLEHDELQSPIANNGVYSTNTQSYMGSDEAVSSLLTLKQGGGSYGMRPQIVRELEGVGLTEEAINHLFNEFWNCYHPYLPFLNPAQSPDQYYQQHPLLFWVIIVVAARRYTADPSLLTALSAPLNRLLWSTIGEVPSTHYVVKALCLLCTWSLPTSTTSTDPSHILGGVMMKTATGIGLHRPNHTQDFSRVSVDLNKEQLHDRVVTWAVCNIVAQNLGTGYGQPASTLYDWTLAVRPGENGPFKLSAELEARLQIERFCDKVSKEMYSNSTDPRGVAGDELRATLTRVYRREYSELYAAIMSQAELSPIVKLYLTAAGLHLRLSAFFDSSTTQGYMDDLMGLWRAANAFLEVVFDLETSSFDMDGRSPLRYATNYILQMIIAACFTLLKHLSSFFASEIDFNQGRQLFHRTIQAIRSMSVINNDLPWRLAELMVQMYNGARVESRKNSNNGVDSRTIVDDSLQLKVRCRMSMSLMFDSIWRWREEFQAQGRGNLEGQHIRRPFCGFSLFALLRPRFDNCDSTVSDQGVLPAFASSNSRSSLSTNSGIDSDGQVPKLMTTNCVFQDQEVVFYKGSASPSKSLNQDQDQDMFSYKGKDKDKVPDRTQDEYQSPTSRSCIYECNYAEASGFPNPTPMNAFDFSSSADDYTALFQQSFRPFDHMQLLDFSDEEQSQNQKQEFERRKTALKNPTNPDSTTDSSASSTHQLESTLMPPSSHQISSHLMGGTGSITPNSNNGLASGNSGLPSSGMGGVYNESNYEVFDPLNWMLDGLVDFPYSYAAVQGLEGGMN
ncbi:Regulatory protein [Lachnellula subtilissima]|uniref:Regulatory protein n=1 Tax=Lachnellula subtilissima TaxID=602034 RepID=A0A8H8U5S5_9HELO|nr:Regulatory protein [Lachnellula subtilissima]